MSNKALNYVWQNSPTKGSDRVVMLAIADMANDTGDCFPGVDRIAKKANLSSRQTTNILRKLEKSGEIIIVDNSGCKTTSGYTNLYTVVMDDNQSHVEKRRKQAQATKTAMKKNGKQGVKPSSPLNDKRKAQGVKSSSPHGVKSSSPHGVKHTSGNPLEEPSVEPSDSSIDDTFFLLAKRWVSIHYRKSLVDHLLQAVSEQKTRNKQIAEIIKVHVDTGVIVTKKFNPYVIPAYREKAEALLDAGFSPGDVQDYVNELKQEPFWMPKAISLDYVLGNILAWKNAREHQPASEREYAHESHRPATPAADDAPSLTPEMEVEMAKLMEKFS